MSPSQAVQLTMIPEGKRVRLVKIQAGRRMNHRLAEMGLTPGVEVTVLQDAGGPLLLGVRGSRIAVGRGMADKLYVRSLNHVHDQEG